MQADEATIEAHLTRFLAMIERAFRGYGGQLPARLGEAIHATPRHRFVHRFRLRYDGPTLDFGLSQSTLLAEIYDDRALVHVDAAGEPLASTNSQPSYILWLLDTLDVQPGDRVLEIGSGSGWLSAIMGRLAGSAGRVTGIEILAELADRSRSDIAALGIDTVTILARDGSFGCAESAPFDKVIFTAAGWDLPAPFFVQLAEGARLLFPLALPGGDCEVMLLRHEQGRFRVVRSSPGRFVPLVGAAQAPQIRPISLRGLPFWNEIAGHPPWRCAFHLGARSPAHFAVGADAFRTFLRLSEPGFCAFEAEEGRPAGFGLVDEQAGSVALCIPDELVCFGSRAAARRIASAYERWTQAAMPGMTGFDVEIVPADRAPPSSGDTFVERRGSSALVWRLKPGRDAWRELLADD